MAYELQKIPYEWQYYYFVREDEDGTKNGSIGYERGGQAYCVAKQPRYGDDEEWKELAELWIDAIETYKKTGVKPSQLLEALQRINTITNRANG